MPIIFLKKKLQSTNPTRNYNFTIDKPGLNYFKSNLNLNSSILLEMTCMKI